MLSAAKHLQYLLENKQMQILRSAQDDSQGDFFRNLQSAPDAGGSRIASNAVRTERGRKGVR